MSRSSDCKNSKLTRKDFIKLKGSRTIFPPKTFFYEMIRKNSFDLLEKNGYNQIILPTYDYESTFSSSLGNQTDIIKKEMFVFSDKKNRKIALRPEGTACVANSLNQTNFISEKKYAKLFYWANMFRYERPQKGRYREFWQLGVEIINLPNFLSDCEAIILADSILKRNHVNNYTLFINYLGGKSTKQKYCESLRDFLKDDFENLCFDCKSRYLSNPLRIADCKKCGKFANKISYEEFISDKEKDYFQRLKNFLNNSSINFVIDRNLVRGISYYSGVVFEFKKNGEDKSIIGGGRYDNLIVNKSKADVNNHYPSIGFAVGIDRIIEFCNWDESSKTLFNSDIKIVIVSFVKNVSVSSFDTHLLSAFHIKEKLQNFNKNIKTIIITDESKNFSKIISIIDPTFSIFIGEREIKNEMFSIKNHRNGKVQILKKELIYEFLNDNISTLEENSISDKI